MVYLREKVRRLGQVRHSGGDVRDDEVALAGDQELPGSLDPAGRGFSIGVQ